MTAELSLLEYLAYRMGCAVISDLRTFPHVGRMQRIIAAIPLEACSTREWQDAARSLTGQCCVSASEARDCLMG